VHAARQTAKCCPQKGTMLVTGGGAYNTFFIEALRKVCVPEIILPDSSVIEFKEALVFAYLGYLRMNNTFNALSSVTGAHFDSISGSIFKA
jgi:anhydro-N-acetylmuramic acid kinase